jgi:hemolysin III
MLSRRRALAGEERGAIWRSVVPVMVGAQAPTIVLVLSALGLYPAERAITIAQIVVAILLFGYGLRVGQILHQHRLLQLISGLALVAIAGLLVAIKVLLH